MTVTRREFVGRWISVSALTVAANSLVPRTACASRRKQTPTEEATPIDLHRNGTFDGIMDIYYENNQVDLVQAKRLGVRAVIYRTSLGLKDVPAERAAYRAAKSQARSLGLLWGAFHVLSHEDVDAQVRAFLTIEDGSDGETLMALDWEGTSRGTATIAQMRDMVTKFHKIRGYYPMIYGGNVLAQECGKTRDDVLAACPLWYIYLLSSKRPALELPKATWPDYTFWQFATEKRAGGDPYPPHVLPGADWSRFKGSVDELRKAWPYLKS